MSPDHGTVSEQRFVPGASTPDEILANPASITGQYLSGARGIAILMDPPVNLDGARAFLDGSDDGPMSLIRSEMEASSERLEFEQKLGGSL